MKTKFNSTLIALALSTTISLFSCKNETEVISQLANPSSIGFSHIRQKALEDISIKKGFKAEEGLEFTTDKGTKIKVPSNCLLDNNNTLVTGEVMLSFVEMYDRGNMVITNKPLMGKNENGDLLPLITGGQFNIEVYKNNQKLKPGCPFYVNIPAGLTGGLDSDMKLWFGNIDEEGDLTWEEVTGEGNQGKRAGITPNSDYATYDIWSNEFGWTNVDRFAGEPDPKAQIKVTVPAAYNHTNSAVYLSYENERNLLARLDIYDSQEHFFTEHYGFLPVGKNVHIIFTSESNGSIVYAIKKVTIAPNAIFNISENELALTSKENLINQINNLN